MTYFIIIAAIVGAVWCGALFLRGGLACGALAVLVAAACFGHPFFHVPAKPMPLTLDRVLWLLLLAQCVLWRRFRWTDPKPMGRVEWLLVVLVCVLGVSTFSHDWRAEGAQPAAWLLFYYLMPLGVYWVVRQSAWSRRDTLILFGVLAAFGVYLAVTAFAETRQWWWLVYPKYIASADAGGFPLGRGRGPFLNPSACGLFQGTCLCAMLMWWPRLGRMGKIVLLGAVAVGLVGIYSTLTRTAWLGGFVGLLIVLGLTLPRRMRVPLVAGSLLLASLLLVTQFERILAFKRDKGLSAREAAESVELRPLLAVVALKMFYDRPLMGHGFGQYNAAKAYYFNDRSLDMPLEKARPYHQHNVFLGLLVETGLIGMGTFALVLFIWTRDAWRLARSGTAPLWVRQMGLLFLVLAANYLVSGMFQDVAIMPSVHILLFLLAGATAALRDRVECRATIPVARTRLALGV